MTPRPRQPLALVLTGSFGEAGDPVYRLHQPAAALAELEGVEVHELQPHGRCRDAAALAADVLVLVMGLDVELLRLVHQRRLLGRPTVLEVNDWLPGVQRCNPAHASWSDSRAWRLLEALARHCDAVQVSSAGLAERLAPLAPRLELLPNQLPEVPPLQPRPAGPLRVGWGGSAGHLDDIRATAPVLVRWLQEHSDVRLEVMADPLYRELFVEAPPERFRFLHPGPVEHYLQWLEGLDVGLAPLLPTDYNACRSDVKFLEYASRGAVPLLQRCATYAAVREGDTGLLFGDGEELVAQLEALRGDPEHRARLAQAAHAYVAGERLLAQQVPQQLAFYADLAERAATAAGSTNTAAGSTNTVDSLPPPARAALEQAAGLSLAELRSGPGWQRRGPRHWRRDLSGAAEQAFAAGLEAQGVGRWSEALEQFRTATAADPADPYALVFLGQALERLGRPGLAQRAYERAAGLDPLCSRPPRALAALHRRQARRLAATASLLNPLAPATAAAAAGGVP